VLRAELSTQLIRLRTLISLAIVAAVPILAAFSYANSAGRRNGTQDGLFGASTYSAMNHAMAGFEFVVPLLLPIIVTVLATAIASGSRDWGVLRYLFVAPVTRTRLLLSQLGATAIATATAVATVLVAGLAGGAAVYGWHPFHLIGAPNLSAGTAFARCATALGYIVLCMLAIAAISFTFGLALPRGAEAVGAAIAFIVLASILNGQRPLHAVSVILPMHYWQNWVPLFDPVSRNDLTAGTVVQLAWIAACIAICAVVLHRRDPAA
jgi:ABC-type transport system involved in multi-copper enzyme maturation permease subunit